MGITDVLRVDPVHPAGVEAEELAPWLFAKVLARDYSDLHLCKIITGGAGAAGVAMPVILCFLDSQLWCSHLFRPPSFVVNNLKISQPVQNQPQ
jgi:hypothetical protein